MAPGDLVIPTAPQSQLIDLVRGHVALVVELSSMKGSKGDGTMMLLVNGTLVKFSCPGWQRVT